MKKVAVYNPYLETKGGGEKVTLALASALADEPNVEVTLLTHTEVELPDLQQYFHIDLSKLKVIYINYETPLIKSLHRLPLPGRLRNFFLDYKAHRTIKKHQFDIFVNNCFQSNLPNPSPLGIYMCMFPQQLKRSGGLGILRSLYLWSMDLLYRLFLYPKHRNGIETYQLITANSHYTQRYIKDYWGRDSEIIYPVCDNMQLPKPIAKRKIIMHVGRFFENSGENHHKRQDFLLQTFASMTDLHDAGWELHFAGSVAEDVGGLRYILELIKAGQNLPVHFHFNASYDELKTLYNQTTIYWHATGYGVSPEEHPEKQEHFGITTVEAMSAGCIPIVINSAGQKETVNQGGNGYLWSTEKELVRYTRQVANMSEKEVDVLRLKARSSAQKFNVTAFRQSVKEMFEKMITRMLN